MIQNKYKLNQRASFFIIIYFNYSNTYTHIYVYVYKFKYLKQEKNLFKKLLFARVKILSYLSLKTINK